MSYAHGREELPLSHRIDVFRMRILRSEQASIHEGDALGNFGCTYNGLPRLGRLVAGALSTRKIPAVVVRLPWRRS